MCIRDRYQLKGWQMLKEENAELIIDGKRVENDYTFVAVFLLPLKSLFLIADMGW